MNRNFSDYPETHRTGKRRRVFLDRCGDFGDAIIVCSAHLECGGGEGREVCRRRD